MQNINRRNDVEQYVIYDIDMNEKLAELSSRELTIIMIDALFDRNICDNIQIQKLRVEGER